MLIVMAFFLLCDISNAQNYECSVKDLKYTVESGTSVNLTWSTDCPSVVRYKIFPTHLRWRACQNASLSDKTNFEIGETKMRFVAICSNDFNWDSTEAEEGIDGN